MSALDDLISGLAGMYDHEHQMVDPARAELAALREQSQRGHAARNFIESRGYYRCDIPACNCGSWHGGNAEGRLRAFHEALVNADVDTNGKTLLGALGGVLSERDALRRTLRSVRSSIRLVCNRDKITEWTMASLREAEAEIDAALRGKEGT